MGLDGLDQRKKYLRDKGESVLDPKETFETEARVAGAKRIVIKGVDIVEKRLIQDISFMKRLGYSVENVTDTSVKISKNF